jgi:hypothetical protein
MALALGLSFTAIVSAQTATKAAAKTSKASAKAAVDLTPPAGAEQVDAAKRVFYGVYDCELGQKIDIVADPQHENYVEVKHLKSTYLMKPVLSSTGAVRLEDVRGEALMVQIASKSMLLNVKTGHRLVDACISPKQRELMTSMAAATTATK